MSSIVQKELVLFTHINLKVKGSWEELSSC